MPIDDILNKTAGAISVETIIQKDTQLLVDKMMRIANGIQGDKKRRTMVGLAAPQLVMFVAMLNARMRQRLKLDR